jgi:hypothetical protein
MKWIALTALLALFLVVMSLVFFGYIWRQRPEPPPGDFVSNWLADYPGDPNKGLAEITIIGSPFQEGGEVIWKTTYEVGGNPTRIQGPITKFKGKASGEGKATVTMVSKTVEGRDFFKDGDRHPQVWAVKRNADGSMEITLPYADTPTTFLLRKHN